MMTVKAKIGSSVVIVVLAIIGLRLGQIAWQQQVTLNKLQAQEKQLIKNQATQPTKQLKTKQVEAKSTIVKASEKAKAFFQLAWEWSSGSDYQNRVKRIKKASLANQAVLSNSYLFPAYSGMADYIDLNGMISRVDQVVYYPQTTNDDETRGVVLVTVNAKHSRDVGNGETRFYQFKITYSSHDNQLTALDYIGRLAVNQSTDINTFNPYE
ncbi:hypothetical protein [Leuconostoc citreum]|uniref:hypothetical protein n=1 Tax=Leuconostoc citreum TaxID=33964 RepID=UPI0032DEEF0F